MYDIGLVHFIDQLSDLVPFLQWEIVAFAISRNNIQSLHRKQTLAVVDHFEDIVEKDLEVKSFCLLLQSLEIDPLIRNYKLAFDFRVIYNLVCISCVQNNLIGV